MGKGVGDYNEYESNLLVKLQCFSHSCMRFRHSCLRGRVCESDAIDGYGVVCVA